MQPSSDLEALQTEINRLRGEGAIYHPGWWLDSSTDGKTGKRYYRKRWLDDRGHKHSEQLSKDAYQELKREMANGRRLARLKRMAETAIRKRDRSAIGLRSLAPGQKPA